MHHHAVGIGAKVPFYQDLLDQEWNIEFLEAHIENLFDGGHHFDAMQHLSQKYDISLHGVGLSLGSTTPPSDTDLKQRRHIIDAVNPAMISEHLAWTRFGDNHLNDLLPVYLNQETIRRVSDHVARTQDAFGRRILIENLSRYVDFKENTLCESEVLNQICHHTECGILLDINNIYIQEHNLKVDAKAFIRNISPEYVGEYHLAGGEQFGDSPLMVDTHGTDIKPPVFNLYEYALEHIGIRPTLYERDTNLPPLKDMIAQTNHIKALQKAFANKEIA